jgi:RHS repeat-associated protein
VYDASGRAVATRVGTEPWTCTTYDARGRATKVDSPTFGGQAARTVTTNYNADPDGTGPKVASPMVTTVTDPAGTIQSETDLLGRVIAYKDVWGNTTTFSYDQAGRETGNAGPVGTIVKGYDNADRLKTLTRNNQELATVAYDPANGRVTSTAYPTGTGKAGNGTTGTFAYDGVGRPSGVTWTGPGGAVLTKDEVGRSLGGDIVDQKTDGNDHHAGNDYVYDAAGRLTEAFVPAPAGVASRHVCYEFGTTTPNGCGAPTVAAVPAGLNTNRTRQIIQGGATSTYTYDDADRLTSTTESGVGTIAYDAHGNTTTIFGETHAYDAADRHVSTTRGTKTVTYVRDATDRIVARKVDGTVVARYGSTGSGDAPDFTTDASNVVQEVTYSLPGGALLTTRGAGNVWSYPNLHGDVAAVANQSGAKQGATKCYDPFGNNLAGGIPDNSAGNFDYGWLGKSQRPLEAEPTLQPVIEMGARQYSPLLGRFIEVDPVEGGSANDYDYVTGEPINSFDLDGTFGFKIGGWKVGDGCPLGKHKGRKGCRGGSVARAAGHGIRSAGGVLRRNWGAIAIVGAGFGCAAATVTIVGGMACGAALGAAINSAAYWTNGRRHTARGWLSAGLGGAFMGAASAMGSSRFVALRGRGGAHMSQLKPWW